MSVRNVVRMGNPQLFTPSIPLENIEALGRRSPGLEELLQDMFDTMQEEGGVGIAAPQIGVNLRVVMFGIETSPRYPEAPEVPFTVLINPEIRPLSEVMEDGWEGCLSVPGLRGVVARYAHIEYRGFDPEGQLLVREVTGFHARVVQHECDHLDGILYPMRIRDFRLFGFEDALDF